MVIRRPSNLVLSIAIALFAALLFVLQLNRLPVKALFAIPLVLLLPGYALTFVLFHRSAIGNATRLLLSVTLSIAMTILGGALLSLTPWGLQEATWMLLLVGMTMTLGALAILRRRDPAWIAWQLPRTGMRVYDLILYELAILLLFAALQVARLPAPPARAEGYTALWILPAPSETDNLQIGIKSQELESQTYRLEIRVNDRNVQAWENIVLQPGASWANFYQVAPAAEKPKTIEARLYRMTNQDTVYRRVLLQPE